VLGPEPGQRVRCPEAYYGAQGQVPVRFLAVWEEGPKEPWYLATMLESADLAETLYRWRMRLECANRDEKTGVLLREGGDAHALRSVLHLHRFLLALCAAEWLCALTGLQAWRDLPQAQPASLDAALIRSRHALLRPARPGSAAQPGSAPWLHRLVDWLGACLRHRTPHWRPWQIRYRLKHWWADSP